MTIPYASLAYSKSIMGSTQQLTTNAAIKDEKVMSNLRPVSRRIDSRFASRRPVFAPWEETRTVALNGQSVNSSDGTFRFGGHLLELTGSVSINGTALTNVEVYPDSTMPPFSLLRLTDCSTSWYSAICSDCSDPQRVSITGIWGYHRDYAHAWLLVDALTAAITTPSATSFTVASVTAEDAYGIPDRISPGHLLKLDSEYVEVVGVDEGTQTVTVIRGAHGTTAATHLTATPVYRFEVEEPVQRAVARQAGMMYSRFGAYTTSEIQGMGEVRYPSDWLGEVMGVLQEYANG